MANLSNINGKFVVEQTTGYVGVGTTDPNYPIEVLNASAEIALNASGASIYRLKSDSTDSFRINKNGVGDRLVIAGNGNATFAGNVGTPSITATSFIEIRNDAASLYFENAANNNYYRLKRSSNDFVIDYYNGSTTSDRLTIDSSGDVGIAMIPIAALDSTLQICETGQTVTSGGDIGGKAATFAGTGGVTNSSIVTIVSTNTSVGAQQGGEIGFAGKFSTGSNQFAQFAKIMSYKKDTTSGNYGGGLQFWTRENGTPTAVKMTIDPSGNVGIGTTSPMTGTNNLGLQIAKGAESSLFMGNPQGGQGAVFQTSDNRHRAIIGANVYDDPSSSWNVFTSGKGIAGISLLADTGGWGTGIDFWCGDTDNIISRMNISSNGNVNIGTTYAGSSAVTGPFVVSHTSSRFLTSSYESSVVSLSAKNNNNNLESLKLAGDSIYFFNGTNTTGSQSMVILNSGNVGIGTTSPTARLNVKASGSTVDQIAVTHSGNTVEIAQLGQSANGNSAGALLLKTNGGTDTVYLDAAGTSYINGGNVGIGVTGPLTKMQINGCLGIGSSQQDPNITKAFVNFSQQPGGSLHINTGLGGGASSGDTITFEYAAVTWKSWSLTYNFASTNGISYGVVGGYWNNSGTSQNQTQQNNLGVSVAVTHNGQSNLITFTFTALGVHAMANFVYMQSGGDGQPIASRVTIGANS